jgi:hypothetical protein
MKPRHVAALGLIGWYLMVPPDARPGLPGNWHSHAPLREWMTVDSFDTAGACRAAKAKLFPDALDDFLETLSINKVIPRPSEESPRQKADDIELSQAGNALCIASDDPRLKSSSK